VLPRSRVGLVNRRPLATVSDVTTVANAKRLNLLNRSGRETTFSLTLFSLMNRLYKTTFGTAFFPAALLAIAVLL